MKDKKNKNVIYIGLIISIFIAIASIWLSNISYFLIPAAPICYVLGFFITRTFDVKLIPIIYPNVDELLESGDNYLKQGNINKAKQLFERVLYIDPNNAAAILGIANVTLRQDKLEEAKQLFERVLNIDPNSAAAILGIANVTLRQDKIEEAKQLFERVLNIDPINAAAILGIANISLQQGKLNEAKDNFKKVLDIDPNNAAAILGLEKVYRIQESIIVKSGHSIVFLLDTSSSMKGEKIQDLKRGILLALKGMYLSDLKESKVGIVRFGGFAQMVHELDELNKIYHSLQRTISELKAEGVTPLKEAIVKGKDILKNEKKRVMIITTDGQPTDMKGDTTDAIKEDILHFTNFIKRDDDIEIICIGIGYDVDQVFLESLASTNKDYIFAENTGELLDILSGGNRA